MTANINRLLTKAIAAHRAGLRSEAVALYTVILKSQPEHADTNHNLGVLALEEGRLGEAVGYIRNAIDTNPNVEQFWVSLIFALCELGSYKEAKEALDGMKRSDFHGTVFKGLESKVALLNPETRPNVDEDLPKTELKNLTELFDQGEFKLALERTIELSQQFTNSMVLLNIEAASNAQLGNYNRSLEQYNKIISADPNYAEAHYNLGSVLLDMGRKDEAMKCLERAVKVAPDYADAYNTIGVLLQDMDDSRAAIKYFHKAIELDGKFVAAHNNLGIALKSHGDISGATESFSKALDLDPNCSASRHMLAAMRGELTLKAPREYVEPLFDRFAIDFDEHLKDRHDYAIPDVFASFLSLEFPDQSFGSVLDLGCGTGLSGKAIMERCDSLIGIDISRPMLEQAREKDFYDHLLHVDIFDYLTETELDFDLFICLDVLVYMGDLSNLFKLIKSKNNRAGYFGFSTEHSDGDSYCLEKSGRYSHSKKYVQELCESIGFDLVRFIEAPLRKENGMQLTGGVYLLKFEL